MKQLTNLLKKISSESTQISNLIGNSLNLLDDCAATYLLPVKKNKSVVLSDRDSTTDKTVWMQLDEALTLLDNKVRASFFEFETKEEQAQHMLKVWIGSSGLAVASVLFYSPLRFLCIPPLIYGCMPIFNKASAGLKEGSVGVDLLSSITIIVCIIGDHIVVANVAGISYAVAALLLIKIRRESQENIIDVFRQRPDSVWIVVNEQEILIPFQEMKKDDILVVQAGEVIPADGVIVSGMACIDQHVLTGESQPAEKQKNDTVFASTIILSGKIYICVHEKGEDTVVSKIGNILNNTSGIQTSEELKAQKITDQTVIPTLILSGISIPFFGLYRSVAILNAHYKYRMSIVAPISILGFLDIFADNGIIIKDGYTLDLLQNIDTVVFDKTGTLTEEQPTVKRIFIFNGYSKTEILQYAAAAETKQSHPIARAILKKARQHEIAIPDLDDSEYEIGYGLCVKVGAKKIHVGSYQFICELGIVFPSNINKIQRSIYEQGNSLVLVVIDNMLAGAIELEPTIRPEAKKIVEQLQRKHGIKHFYIISGDHEAPTKALAEELNIDNYFANTLPTDKSTIIEQLQENNHHVCYIGDGINDSIALKKAHVSISFCGASSVAQDTAQIILMDGSLEKVVPLFDYAKEFRQNVKQCFLYIGAGSVVALTGVLFFQLGLLYTIFVSHTSLAVGIWNATNPRRKHKKLNVSNKK